jgi:hypothetical protein
MRAVDTWRNCGRLEWAVADRVTRCCLDANELLRRLEELAEKGPLVALQMCRRMAPPMVQAAAAAEAVAEEAEAAEAAETAKAAEAPAAEASHAEPGSAEPPAEETRKDESQATPWQPAEPAPPAPEKPKRTRKALLPPGQGWLQDELTWQINAERAELEAALKTEGAITAMRASAALCRSLSIICHALNIDKALIMWPPGMAPERHPRKRRPRKKRGPSPAHRRREAYYASDVGRGPEERYPRPPSPKLPLRYFHRRYFPH